MRQLPPLSWWRLAAGLGVMSLAALVYAGTLGHPAVWDDHVFVFGQDFLKDCGNLGRVLDPRSFLGVLPARSSARPAWLASVLLDTCAGGGLPRVYRMTSLFWHAAGAGVVMALAWSLSGRLLAAFLAGALFAVHPVHTEAVNVVTFRADLLCLAFMGLSLLLYRAAARGSRPLLAAAGASAALALLSKEMAVSLPLLLWLTDEIFPEGAPPARRRRACLAAALALVAVYAVFRAPRSGYTMRSSRDAVTAISEKVPLPFAQPLERAALPYGSDSSLDDPPWARVYSEPWTRLLTMSRVFGSYARLLLWPRPLQSDYAPRPVDSVTFAVAASWAFWGLLLAAAWRGRRRWPLASYGALWTAAALLPVSGLIALRNLQAERYLYVPSAGACLALGALLAAAFSARRRWAKPAAAAAAAVLIAAGAAQTVRRNRDFSSDEAFFRAAAAVDADVPSTRLALALMAEERGLDAQAEEHYRAALALWPGSRKAEAQLERFLAARARAAARTRSTGRAAAAGRGRRE